MDQLRAEGVSMIPTLKLLRHELAKEQVPKEIAERIVNESVQEFGKFAAAASRRGRTRTWWCSMPTPAQDVKRFAAVKCVVRGGKVVDTK